MFSFSTSNNLFKEITIENNEGLSPNRPFKTRRKKRAACAQGGKRARDFLASDWLRIWRDTFSQPMVVEMQKKGNRQLSFQRQLINTLQLQQLVLHQSKIRIIILTCSPPGCVNPQSEGTSSQLAARDPYKDVKEMIEHDGYCGEPMT